MSNLSKFTELYKSIGIDLDPVKTDDGFEVTLEANTHEKLIGYEGFCTIIKFDKNGRFVWQGFFE